MSSVLGGLFTLTRGRRAAPVDYDTAKRQAADDDSRVRRRLAQHDNVQPEILYFLASDADGEVRREIAANPGTPVQADALLARDADETVRLRVAEKVARLAPGLSDNQRRRAGDLVTDILETLARDQAIRVRRALAEELQSARGVPASVIETLARDPEIDVSGPVLRNSPLLSDGFLIEIIASPPVREALAAVAGRKDLDGEVADAIVTADDCDAITALLRNDSAQIREETLDRIIDRAPPVIDWHEPLVSWPSLSARAAAALARFVTDALVEKLLARTDLDPSATEAIGDSVRRRLAPDGETGDEEPRETASQRARRLYEAGALDEAEISAALGRGERAFVVEALALLGDIHAGVVQKAFSLASAKGVTAVAWKAGLSARTAHQLQLRIARIAPADALRPAGGRYALGEKDLNWQLEFLGA